MEARINHSALGTVLILMAAGSLLVMFSLNQISYIVHGDLYRYGLQFSYRWAMPFWVLSAIVFGLSWVNVIISAIVALYVFKKRQRGTSTSKGCLKTMKAAEESEPTGQREHVTISGYTEELEEKA